MPRLQQVAKTATEKAREYARQNRSITSYDVGYWLTVAAFKADGKAVPEKPDYVRSVSEMDAEHKAQLSGALSALGLSGASE